MTAPQPVFTPSAALHVRAVQAADLDALVQLEAICHGHPWGRGHFADALQHHNLMLGVWQLNGLNQDLSDSVGCGLGETVNPEPSDFATAPAALLAYVVALPGVEEMHILNVTTAPTARRQGLARLLLTYVFNVAATRGDAAVWLEVRVSNQAAIALYTAMGFERISVRKDYYPLRHTVREDALVMRRELHLARPASHSAHAPLGEPDEKPTVQTAPILNPVQEAA